MLEKGVKISTIQVKSKGPVGREQLKREGGNMTLRSGRHKGG